jgi:hypothetical protein
MKSKVVYFTFSLVFIIGLFSCKKDTEENAIKAAYIEKIFLNGHLNRSFEYNNFIIHKINSYDTTGKIISYSTYEYNSKNKVSKIRNYNSSGVFPSLIVNDYNSRNQLTKSTTYLNDTSTNIFNTLYYEYDTQGNCVKHQYQSSFSKFYFIFDYKNGNPTNCYVYDMDNTLKATINYIFDTKNNFTQFESITPVMYSRHNTLSYSSTDVDQNGVLTVKLLTGSVSFLLFNSTFEYNANNFPVKETRTYVDKRRKVEVYEYQYLQ